MSEQTDSMQGPLEEKPKPQHPDEFSLRRERIEEYVLQALSSSSTTQAVLGAMNGDLMLYALAIREAVDDSITSGPKSLESLTPLLPPIAAYTRAARQIDRFTKTLDQLQKREEGGGPAEEAKN